MKNPIKHLSKQAIVVAILSIVIPNLATAITPDEVLMMTKLTERVESIPRPSKTANDFTKWAYDTSVATLLTCTSRIYHPDVPAQLRARINSVSSGSPLRVGVYSLPTNSERQELCASLAQDGFQPWCTDATIFGDKSQETSGIPRDYIQLSSYGATPKLRATLNCYVGAKRLNKQRFVPDTVNATWVMPPRPTSFTLSIQGPASVLNAGSIRVDIPYVPSWENRGFTQTYTAVIIP